MKIIQILTNEKTEAEDKVKAVEELVVKVRAKYGNADTEIKPVKVHTADGWVNIGMLSVEEKAAVALKEIKKCSAQATEETEATEGAVFDRKFEELVATNAVLCNITQASASEY